jgi:hypothetical protein
MECGKKNVCAPTLKVAAREFGLTIAQILKGF